MIPTPDQLKDIATRRKGDLSEVSYAVLVLALAVNRKSVVLEMRKPPLEKSIVFDEGSPVDCRSNVVTESLGRFMVSAGKLTESDYQGTLNGSAARGVPFEDILTERGLVSATELYRILQQNLARKLLDGFSWGHGSFRISYDVPPVESPLRVKVSQLLVTGIAKFAAQTDIDAAVASFAGTKLALNPHPLFSLDELRLTTEQQAAMREMESGRTLEELMKSSSLPSEDFDRLLYPLLLLRIAVPEDQIERKLAPVIVPEVAPRPLFELETLHAAPPPAAPFLADSFTESDFTPPLRDAARSREELMRVYISFRRKDAFDLLEVSEDASQGAITEAYLCFADRFAPTKFENDSTEALRDKAQEVFLAGARAYGELADSERQGALIAKRQRSREQPKPVAATEPVAAKPVNLLDPEFQYRLGRELADAGKHREALSHFQLAAECDAQNGVYLAESAYCRFELMISTAAQTLATLKQVMRIDPKCGLAWYYTGKVHATLGNKMEAEAYLDKGKSMIAAARRSRR